MRIAHPTSLQKRILGPRSVEIDVQQPVIVQSRAEQSRADR